jgi:hypothetical protein
VVGQPFVVRVEKRDPLAVRRLEAGVTRLRWPEVLGVADDTRAQGRRNGCGVVGRVVVDHDDLLGPQPMLGPHAAQAAADLSGAVVRRDDYAHRDLGTLDQQRRENSGAGAVARMMSP